MLLPMFRGLLMGRADHYRAPKVRAMPSRVGEDIGGDARPGSITWLLLGRRDVRAELRHLTYRTRARHGEHDFLPHSSVRPPERGQPAPAGGFTSGSPANNIPPSLTKAFARNATSGYGDPMFCVTVHVGPKIRRKRYPGQGL